MAVPFLAGHASALMAPPPARQVDRHEACRVLLRGRSEFEARDVTLAGDLTFEVPDGYRMTVSPAGPGADKWRAELVPLDPYAPPSWRWRYSLGQDNVVRLEMDEAPAAPAMPPLP